MLTRKLIAAPFVKLHTLTNKDIFEINNVWYMVADDKPVHMSIVEDCVLCIDLLSGDIIWLSKFASVVKIKLPIPRREPIPSFTILSELTVNDTFELDGSWYIITGPGEHQALYCVNLFNGGLSWINGRTHVEQIELLVERI